MDYSRAIEKNDLARIEKLNKLTDKETFWAEVRKLTKAVKSDHSISRWQCLAEARYDELTAFCDFGELSRRMWIDGCRVEIDRWIKCDELRIGVSGYNPGGRVSEPLWERSIIVKGADAVKALENIDSVARAIIWGNLARA